MTGFANLRVCLIGPLPPPAGGMAAQTAQLADLLRREGAAVKVIPTNAPYRPAAIARVPVLRAVFRLVPYLWQLARAAGQSDVFHVMANSGWSWHLFAVPAIWLASLRGVPAVVNYRGGEAADFLARAARVVRFSMRRAARLAVPSAFLEQVFARHGMKAEVVPNVIDLARFHPPRERRCESAPHVVVARNLEPIYDNVTALRAFAAVRRKHREARLTIAGTGPQERGLRTCALELGLGDSVRFSGRLDRDAMADLYRNADVCLNPSLADNMPNSVLEALASGVPVVSTIVGGIPFVVRDGETALLVAPRDGAAMADAALRILDDGDLRRRLSDAGVAEVQRYDWSRVGPVLAGVYRGALSRPTARRPA